MRTTTISTTTTTGILGRELFTRETTLPQRSTGNKFDPVSIDPRKLASTSVKDTTPNHQQGLLYSARLHSQQMLNDIRMVEKKDPNPMIQF